jgi:putative transposase
VRGQRAVKKSFSLLCPGNEVIYRMIAQEQQKADIARLCRVFQVSRSGFYAARLREQAESIVCSSSVHLKAAFQASGGNYGSRRLCAALRAQGLMLGRHRVRRLMKRHGLRARWKRKFVATTNSAHTFPIADNVLQRQFSPAAADQAWVADITYIRTRRGWLYLAAVLDLF